jgi:hypothetical protein
MRIGDKVWVVLIDCSDGNFMALPQHPQMGEIVGTNEGFYDDGEWQKGAYDIKIGNSVAYAYREDMFMSKSDAWEEWQNRMEYIIHDIRAKIISGQIIRDKD